jgi:DNA-binding NtrC family response regulator
VRLANHTFLDLAQIGAENAIVGQKAQRWLSRPGADMSVILNLVKTHGFVRRMTTTLEGELGSSADVEISAVGNQEEQPEYIGLLARDVTMRWSAAEAKAAERAVEDFGTPWAEDLSLEQIVRATTEAIERKTIASALARFHGNRTAAAKHLGLSRQSLHAKLNKYDL